MSSHSTHIKFLVPVAVLAVLFVLPGGAAQTASNLGVSIPADEVEVMPGGPAGLIHGNVTYQCGTTVNDITVTATLPEGSGGSVAADPATIPPTNLPDCTPQETPASPFAVSFTPGMDQIADTKVAVDVMASTSLDATGTTDADTAAGVANFVVGPYVDVTFTPNITTIDAAAGDEVPVSVMIESKSNTLVMAMPSIEAPATWERPDALPRNVKSPLEDGEDGMDTLEFVIKIPADASGTVTLELTLFAHSLTKTYVQTAETMIPFTVNVAPGDTGTSGDDGEDEESPALPVAPVVIAGVALLAWARRR